MIYKISCKFLLLQDCIKQEFYIQHALHCEESLGTLRFESLMQAEQRIIQEFYNQHALHYEGSLFVFSR